MWDRWKSDRYGIWVLGCQRHWWLEEPQWIRWRRFVCRVLHLDLLWCKEWCTWVHRDSELILDPELIIRGVGCEYHRWYFISFRNVREWLHSCGKTGDLVSKVFILSNMRYPWVLQGLDQADASILLHHTDLTLSYLVFGHHITRNQQYKRKNRSAKMTIRPAKPYPRTLRPSFTSMTIPTMKNTITTAHTKRITVYIIKSLNPNSSSRHWP